MGNVPSASKFDVRKTNEIAGPRFDQRIFDNFKGDDGKITRDRLLALEKHHTSAEILFALAGKATRDKGDIVLLNADWLIDWYEKKKQESKHVALPCRQELPTPAFVFARTCDQEKTDICFVSYPWYTIQHPDPLGFHLSIVVPLLKLYQALTKKKLAVFWDWCSLHQAYYPPAVAPPTDYFAEQLDFSERTPEQEKWYNRALSNVGDFLVNNKTLVLVQSHQAEDPEGFKLMVDMKSIMNPKEKDESLSDEDNLRKKLFDLLGIKFLDETVIVLDVQDGKDGHKGGVRSGFYFAGISDGEEDTLLDSIAEITKKLKVFDDSRIRHPRLIFKRASYDKRGWCCFEQRLAELISPQDMVLDLGHLMRTMRRVQRDALRKTLVTSDFKTYGHLEMKNKKSRWARLMKEKAILDNTKKYANKTQEDGKGDVTTKNLIDALDYMTEKLMHFLTIKFEAVKTQGGVKFQASLSLARDLREILRKKKESSEAKDIKVNNLLARKATEIVTDCLQMFDRDGVDEFDKLLTEYVDLNFEHNDVDDNLAHFLKNYSVVGAKESAPGSWPDFMLDENVNLVKPREHPPLDPSGFDAALAPCFFTHPPDQAKLSDMYKLAFETLFRPQVPQIEFNFASLGWSFDLQTLWNEALSHNAPRLIKLDISHNVLLKGKISVFTGLRVVRDLNFAGCSDVEGSLDSLASCVMLRRLDVSGCSKLGGTLEALAQCPKLEKVNLKGCSMLTGAVNPLEFCTEMTHLSLSGCVGFDDFGGIRSLEKLEELDVGHTVITDLEEFKNLKVLKKLNLECCYFLKGSLEPLHTCIMLEEVNVCSEDPLTPLRIATPLSLAALSRARYRNEDLPMGLNRGEDAHLGGVNAHQLKIITSYKI